MGFSLAVRTFTLQGAVPLHCIHTRLSALRDARLKPHPARLFMNVENLHKGASGPYNGGKVTAALSPS